MAKKILNKKSKGKAKKSTRVKAAKKISIKIQKPVGIVTHYYNHLKVGIVKFSKAVKQGAEVRFEGATTDFNQKLVSMQYDHKPVKVAPKGKQVGLRVAKRVREGDAVFEI